jgi:vacuolar-type H+-ATPase subunit H
MTSITAFFETLIEEESIEFQTKVKVNFEKRIEDLNKSLTAIVKHCGNVQSMVTQWGEVCKNKITEIVESFHQQIRSAETEAKRILQEQTDEMKHSLQDIEDALKNYEDVRMSENSKLIVKFQSQIDQLSSLPSAKKIYLPKFVPSSSNLQAGLQRNFGELNSEVHNTGREFSTPLPIRTFKRSKNKHMLVNSDTILIMITITLLCRYQ